MVRRLVPVGVARQGHQPLAVALDVQDGVAAVLGCLAGLRGRLRRTHLHGQIGADEAEGVDGTDDLQPNTGRIDLRFWLCGIPRLGVLLSYDKIGGGLRESYCSKGNLKRLNEWVRNLHNTPLPVGLFIPFDAAWYATREFIESDGKLPKCIEWIADKDLPPGTFPDP